MSGAVTISAMGERAWLLDAADGDFDETVQRRIWGLAERLRADASVEDVVPGMNNLLVRLRGAVSPDEAPRRLADLWSAQAPSQAQGRTVEVPTVYGGERGGDLAELARHAALSVREVVRRHAAADYLVAALGAMPGFPYLAGLDPALACPRLAQPRRAVERGSVIVGGAQAAVMPLTAPSGWRVIGWTPLVLFDPLAEAPALLAPGDRVRFIAVDVLA